MTRSSLAAAIVLAACSSPPEGIQRTDPTGSLSVTPGVDTLFIGDAVRFATLRDSGPLALGDSGPVSWTVSDSRVATIEQQGAWWALVRAVHEGTTTVSAAKGSSTASALLFVNGTRLAFSGQPSNATAGVSLAPAVVVTIEDTSGTAVRSATSAVAVALGANAGGGTLSGTTTVTAVNGVATFHDLSLDKVANGYTLVASSGTLWRVTSTPFAIAAAAPAQLAFIVQPSPNPTQQAQPITPVQVAIQDAFANTVTSATNTVTLALSTNPSGGTLSGTTSMHAVSGVATFANLTIDRAGTGYTLVATTTALTAATSTPFDIRIRLTFARVSAGNAFTCGVATTSAAYCWGVNDLGQLGDGTRTSRTTPVAVSGGLTFATVSGGGTHTCGVAPAGAAYCWGSNGAGELGSGTSTGPQQCAVKWSGTPYACSTTPLAVAGGVTFASVSAGGGFTCGVAITGATYCWGGDGAQNYGAIPVAVSGGLTFATVSGGGAHTCGVTPAGGAYCWGYDAFGQLGSYTWEEINCGVNPCSRTPVVVSGGLAFVMVSAGGAHTCGLTLAGAAYCWGRNDYGELGNGTSTGPQTCPTTDGINDYADPCSTTPMAVVAGLTFATVSPGGNHTCGVTPAGAAYCWGKNDVGQLGDGTRTSRTTPVAVSGGLTFATVSAGGNHTCGVTPAGTAYCWGDNTQGELGTWTSGTASSVPVPVNR